MLLWEQAQPSLYITLKVAVRNLWRYPQIWAAVQNQWRHPWIHLTAISTKTSTELGGCMKLVEASTDFPESDSGPWLQYLWRHSQSQDLQRPPQIHLTSQSMEVFTELYDCVESMEASTYSTLSTFPTRTHSDKFTKVALEYDVIQPFKSDSKEGSVAASTDLMQFWFSSEPHLCSSTDTIRTNSDKSHKVAWILCNLTLQTQWWRLGLPTVNC